MNQADIRRVLIDALASVAPEGDYDRLKPDRPLRDQLDLDSYDFLNVVVRLHEQLGVDIPEADYQKLATLDSALAHPETADFELVVDAPAACETRVQTALSIRINADENRELTQRMYVEALPTLMIYKNGKRAWTGEGFANKERIEEYLDK